MKVLVTGTEGYIGARLAPWLRAAGHGVTGLDTGFYRDGTLYSDAAAGAQSTVVKDLRTVTAADFAGFDAVVHLAELSNDPLGEHRPEITYRINHEGSVRIAQAARAAGVRRFVYASSCSVYGVGAADFVDETAAVNPQTAYARCKVLVERDLLPMSADDFCVTVLRNATAYGPSPRMRFDIVLNDLCALAWTQRKIVMTSDGSPWRPLVHVEDICDAVRCALQADGAAVGGEVFNVGATTQNYRVREIASIVAAAMPGCAVSAGPPSADQRSYRVNFDKIATRLPGFTPRWTVQRGAEELRELFARIGLTAEMHGFRAYTRLRQLTHLVASGQLDADLFWVRR
jgi:nucleoside-diphosphate-sugar epimerase